MRSNNGYTHSQSERREETVAQEIIACKLRIQNVLLETDALGEEDVQRAYSFLNVLAVFETEIACQLKHWERILEVIEVKPQRSRTITI